MLDSSGPATSYRRLRRAPRYALMARAIFAQEFPGIHARLVPVIPLEADGVTAHRFDIRRLRPWPEHGQFARFGMRRGADSAPALAALFVAQRARTRIAQPPEAVKAAVAVLPGDLHPRTSAQAD